MFKQYFTRNDIYYGRNFSWYRRQPDNDCSGYSTSEFLTVLDKVKSEEKKILGARVLVKFGKDDF